MHGRALGRVQQFKRERGHGDGQSVRGNRDCRAGADIYRDSVGKYDVDGDELAVHVFLYALPNGVEPEPRRGDGKLHQRADPQWRFDRHMGDYHDRGLKRSYLHSSFVG